MSKLSNSIFFLLFLQISQLKCQIEDERQKNKKSKEKVMALQEDIERSVSIVTAALQSPISS